METENLENILPALSEAPRSHMSSKEFQRTLYTWFEEKGLVSDLRSYLRLLMINELKHSSVVKVENKSNFSLSKQAFSLLIAEHLLKEGHHYTLSIYSTEVPSITNQLPFNLHAASNGEKWRFDQESLLNVLELVGISKGSSESLRISALYFRSKDSLLHCLVNSKRVGLVDLSQIEEGDYVVNILNVLGVPPNLADSLKRKIEQNFSSQIPDYQRQIKELDEVVSERNNQIRVLVDEQIEQKKENKKLKSQVKEFQKRLKHALLKEQNLNTRETEIRRKLDEVTRLQKSIEKSINKEKDEICAQKHCTESCQSLFGVNEDLKNEVSKLDAQNKEKIIEIERLNSKISLLNKDLQNSRVNIDFLNTCLLRSSQINLQQAKDGSSSSEESSENLTGKILHQVRSKLQDLERESEELDVKLKKITLVTK